MRTCPPLAPALQGQVFVGRDAVDRGLLTAPQLRTGAVRRILHGVYADARLPLDHGVRITAAALVLPPSVIIAGRSAAWLHGARLARAEDPVEVLANAEVRRHSRGMVSVHTGPFSHGDCRQLRSLRVTTPQRTCVDVARWHEEATAVSLIDALLALGRLDPADLDRPLRTASLRGLGRARRAVALADGRAASAPESLLRVRLIRAGLPPPQPQLEVWHEGRFIARVDLGWREARLAVEYDGAWHGERSQLARDRRRLNALLAAGWTVIHVTASDLRDLSPIVEQVRRSLRAAA